MIERRISIEVAARMVPSRFCGREQVVTQADGVEGIKFHPSVGALLGDLKIVEFELAVVGFWIVLRCGSIRRA
jgi:hypothetical protein